MYSEPNQIENLIEQSKILGDAKKYDLADKKLFEVLALEPNNIQAYYLLGVSYVLQSRLKEAKEITEKGLVSNPNSSSLHSNLFEIYFLEKNKKLAIEYAKKALEFGPNNSDNYFNLYRALELSKPQRPENLEYILTALKLKPDEVNYLNHYAAYLNYHKQYDKAEEIYLKSLSLDPNNPASHNDLGTVYSSQNQYQKAKQQFISALKLNPNLKQAEKNLVEILKFERPVLRWSLFVLAAVVAIPVLPIILLSLIDKKFGKYMTRFMGLVILGSILFIIFAPAQLKFYGIITIIFYALYCIAFYSITKTIEKKLTVEELSKHN